MAFKFELHAALSLVGFQNNNRTFPVRERTFGELANGLCECPVVVLKADQCNVIWRRCDSRSSRYSIDLCHCLSQLVQLTVKVTSLVLFLAVNPHVNPNYGR